MINLLQLYYIKMFQNIILGKIMNELKEKEILIQIIKKIKNKKKIRTTITIATMTLKLISTKNITTKLILTKNITTLKKMILIKQIKLKVQ